MDCNHNTACQHRQVVGDDGFREQYLLYLCTTDKKGKYMMRGNMRFLQHQISMKIARYPSKANHRQWTYKQMKRRLVCRFFLRHVIFDPGLEQYIWPLHKVLQQFVAHKDTPQITTNKRCSLIISKYTGPEIQSPTKYLIAFDRCISRVKLWHISYNFSKISGGIIMSVCMINNGLD